MPAQGFNINQAAKKLGVSTRTIRRYIKAGKIRAELVRGSFGEEYRILELPLQFDPTRPLNGERAVDRSGGGAVQGMELIRELQEKNLALAAQLGAAAERIRGLEGQLKLLAAPKKQAREPWWRRWLAILPHRRPG